MVYRFYFVETDFFYPMIVLYLAPQGKYLTLVYLDLLFCQQLSWRSLLWSSLMHNSFSWVLELFITFNVLISLDRITFSPLNISFSVCSMCISTSNPTDLFFHEILSIYCPLLSGLYSCTFPMHTMQVNVRFELIKF